MVHAQEHNAGETIFGIELKGIIPTNIANSGVQEMGDDSISIALGIESGFAFGMLIRHNYSKMFTLETGIRVARRYFPVDFKHENDALQSSRVELNTYSIPVQWLLYIRLGEQVYMNTLLGLSLDFYPSEVTKTFDDYAYIIIRKSWINASILASIGFEYRTKKSGFIYLGASLNRPFGDIGEFRLSYFHEGNQNDYVNFSTGVTGTYLSIDARYFFPRKDKKEEPKYY